MKLWLVEQGDNTGYDTYDSIVVAAETEDDARMTTPCGRWVQVASDWKLLNTWNEDEALYSGWTRRLNSVNAQLLGEAAPGTEAGIILSSFNAG